MSETHAHASPPEEPPDDPPDCSPPLEEALVVLPALPLGLVLTAMQGKKRLPAFNNASQVSASCVIGDASWGSVEKEDGAYPTAPLCSRTESSPRPAQ